MDMLFQFDPRPIFIPTLNLLELWLRGTLVYLLLFAVLRVFRREAGGLNVADMLVIVLIADASQNAMGSEYRSVTEGAVLVATITAWDYLFDWLAYQYDWFRRVVRAAPLPLIKDGHLQRKNLRQEWITVEELTAELRQQGVENIARVKRCYLEGDGRFSVIR
jgi:uncharacterized membrane protein YcaP (DUF421 family)